MRLLLALSACLLLSACGSSSGSQPSQPNPIPPSESQPLAPSRRGLWFGYFGSDDAQVDETRDHTNMLFAAWGSDEQLAARIAKAAMPTILDVSDCLFTDGMPRRMRVGAEAGNLLHARLAAIKDAGALSRIVGLYVIDEPERESNVPVDDIHRACLLCRFAADEFGLTPALHICFGDGEDYRGSEFVDWIGVNAYHDTSEQYRERIARVPCRADQRIVAYPGGGDPYRQDARSAYELAQENKSIVGICAFLWVKYAAGNGIRDNGLAPSYCEVGQAILAANKGDAQ